MQSVKYIGMDVHKEAISVAVLNSSGQAGDGVHDRNQGHHHSGFPQRIARKFARDVGRRHLGGLVV